MKIFKSVARRESGNKHELILNQQQISHIIALLLLCAFFIFMAGYYWGKKNGIGLFTEQLESDALADKVSYAFSSLYDVQEQEDDDKETENTENGETQASTQSTSSGGVTRYYARLAGFGTLTGARECMTKLRNKGFSVSVITRESKNSRGKIVTWYQVVTEQLERREDLVALITKIKNMKGCMAPHQTYEITEITQEN